MKIVGVRTYDEYLDLMRDLDHKGYTWSSGSTMKSMDCWHEYKSETAIRINPKTRNVSYSSRKFYNGEGETIEEYDEFYNNVELINVVTQNEYDELMEELEDEGYTWSSGKLPTNYNIFNEYGVNTVIEVKHEYNAIMYSSRDWFESHMGEAIYKGLTIKRYSPHLLLSTIRVSSQSDYDELMEELESEGIRWMSGCKPRDYGQFEEPCVLFEVDMLNKKMWCGSVCSNHIVEFKSKLKDEGEMKMETKFKLIAKEGLSHPDTVEGYINRFQVINRNGGVNELTINPDYVETNTLSNRYYISSKGSSFTQSEINLLPYALVTQFDAVEAKEKLKHNDGDVWVDNYGGLFVVIRNKFESFKYVLKELGSVTGNGYTGLTGDGWDSIDEMWDAVGHNFTKRIPFDRVKELLGGE